MKFVIKSKNRIKKLSEMTYALLKKYDVSDKDIYIFITQEDLDKYSNTFTECNCIVAPKGIANTDNFIVDYFEEGENYIYMNDDVSKIFKLEGDAQINKKYEINKEEFDNLINNLFEEMKKDDVSYGGLYPCDSAMYMKNAPKISKGLSLIMDPFSAVINNKEVKITEIPVEKEDGSIFIGDNSDAEKTIQHFISKKGLVRFNKYCLKVQYYGNDAGGIVGRDAYTEKYTAEYIKDLYPEYITSINTRKNGNTSLRLKKIKGKHEDIKN